MDAFYNFITLMLTTVLDDRPEPLSRLWIKTPWLVSGFEEREPFFKETASDPWDENG